MPELSPDEVERLRARMSALREFYRDECTYPYRQSELLKQTSKHKGSEGVCLAMSLDWLRRRLWNAYNPAAQAKRNFDAAKYDAASKRAALTAKHAKLQDVYERNKPKAGSTNVHTLLGQLAEASVVGSGMDRMHVGSLGVHETVPGYEFDEAKYQRSKDSKTPMGCPNAHFKFQQRFRALLATARAPLSDAAPAVGLLFEMRGDGGGHAVALFLTRTRDWFFDPNLGEYTFAVAIQEPREVNFVADVWFHSYHSFFGMDELAFSLIRYGPPVAARA